MRIKDLKPIGLLFCLSYLKINLSLYNSLSFSRICAIIFYNNSAPTYNSISFLPMMKDKKIRPFIIPIVVTLVVLVLFHSIFMLGYVSTESMEPTLETGSLILGLRIFDELETGDIIIFRRDGSYLVKRIAACAGDTIDHQNSIVTVPDNCYYVLGDNAENSHDSRYWADPYVSHEDVIAKLLMPIK